VFDYAAILFNPIYTIQGVPAALLLADGRVIDGITALDKTAGIDVGGGDVQVQTIAPAACVRVGELTDKGVALDDLIRARLLMSGNEWKVMTHRPKPSANRRAQWRSLLDPWESARTFVRVRAHGVSDAGRQARNNLGPARGSWRRRSSRRSNVLRNSLQIPEKVRPACVILDAEEEADEIARRRR
jgi:hypothetical protein